jgi:hypothetical protein
MHVTILASFAVSHIALRSSFVSIQEHSQVPISQFLSGNKNPYLFIMA